MTQVLVRAALPLAAIRMGVEVRVEETDDVKNMINDGKLIVLARYPEADDAVPAAEPVVGVRQDGWLVTRGERGEYDATHGEADPEPGDPDFDEYSSTFDADLDAPLPPARKRRRGD